MRGIKNTNKYLSNTDKIYCNLRAPKKYWKSISQTDQRNTLLINNKTDANWYLVQTWGTRYGRKFNYKHGRSFGACVYRNGEGYFYEAEGSGTAKPNSWVNISYIIGGRGWYSPSQKHYLVNPNSKAYKDFPVAIKQIKKLRIKSIYKFTGTGSYNHNLTLWLQKPGQSPPIAEIMIKFNRTYSGTYKFRIGRKKINNHDFSIYTNKGSLKKFTKFWSVDFQDKKQKYSKSKEYKIDIDLNEIFRFLIEKGMIKDDLILPGIDFTTEIWDGSGKIQIENLEYKLELAN